MMTHFLFIGGPEIFVILLLVVLLFGADKIPEIARGLGKGIRQVKDATNDIKREINNSIDTTHSDANGSPSKSVISDVIKEVEEVKKSVDNSVFGEVKKGVEDVKKNIDDLTGPIKRSR